nr:PstS family phosphate ABC transporter substrate-binding protein [Paenibacillus oceani]
MLSNTMRKGTIMMSSAVLALTLAACGQKPADDNKTSGGATPAPTKTEAPKLSGEIKIDGSSTVYPISQAVAEEFMKKNKDVKVTVGFAGSSAGIKKLLNKEIDIADASKLMKQEEIDAIKAKGDDVVKMPVAFDGITVVVNSQNDWAKDITVAELKKIWEKDSKITKWSEVRAGWPDQPIKLYGPGTASGTFEYFTEAVNGKAKESRSDFTPSEDDNVLVKGVTGDKNAMAYFGYAYYLENKDKLKALAIKVDDNAPAIAPTAKTIEDGTYKPLSRQIYMYPLKSALDRPEVKEFIKYYMSEDGKKLVESVGYVKLTQNLYDENLKHVK